MIYFSLQSFIAGMLTILAPCTIALLPIIFGQALTQRKLLAVFLTIGSMALSIIVFTLAIKGTALAFSIDERLWQFLSAIIIALVGVSYLFSDLWSKVSGVLYSASGRGLAKAYHAKGMAAPIAIGIALGPVFSSCSPTYAIILATILPASMAEAVIYLVLYVVGLSLMLFVLILGGSRLIAKLNWTLQTEGVFRKGVGVTFIIIALIMAMGGIKQFEIWLLDLGFLGSSMLDFKLF